MSSITDIDKRYLEKILDMQNGYVLDYSDSTFASFFDRYKINIHGSKYQIYGTSKAKKMRAFWKCEPNDLVGRVLEEMLDSYKADCDLNNREMNDSIFKKSQNIATRLSKNAASTNSPQVFDDFLHREFTIPNIKNLPIEAQLIPIIESRLNEALVALGAAAYLSVIFLCGSILEAILLGAAQNEPLRFNKASSSPKTKENKVKHFHEWSLSQFIDVACEINLLKPDVKKFSHGLRDFRNYIHPYEEIKSDFTPDEHTAKLCFQVLRAALASVAGERK